MIIQNGTIEVQNSSGGGLDSATGYPRQATITWGDKIPCQYIRSKYNLQAMVNNEKVTEQQLVILIEDSENFTADRIRLKDINEETIGEYSVISIEKLCAVGEIKITV